MLRKIKNRFRYYKNILIMNRIIRICSKSKRLSSLYYYLFDKSFDREHNAVLLGRLKHIEDSKNKNGNYFMLVRNIHRIEKGLLMRPKRPVFAKDYIKETVSNFISIWDDSRLSSNPQMKWFADILVEYFKTASSDPFVFTQYERFLQVVQNSLNDTADDCEVKAIPYKRLNSNKSDIAFEEFYKLTKQRRSVRWFVNQSVDRLLIDKAILAANQSPSACNRQPFEFHVFDDPSLVKELVSYPMGTIGYGHSIPIFIVIVGNLDAYFDERDRHVIYIDASLSAMSLMLALETMGLSSVSINWPDVEERESKMESFLNLQKHQRPIMCMGVGYPDPDGLIAYSEKRSLDQIRIYNK